MLDFADQRWTELSGGYRTPRDLRPFLADVETSENRDDQSAWHDLWQELYHQGDVGEGSFAAVPHIVRIYRNRAHIDWNPYALVAAIELARGSGGNPDVPDWLSEGYRRALLDLRDMGLEELAKANDAEVVRPILAILAITSGAREHGRVLLDYSEEELLDLESRMFGDDEQ